MRRRSQFLINKRFQLKYCFYVVSWIVALTIVYPLLFNHLFDQFITLSRNQGVYEIVEALELNKAETMNQVVWLQISLVGVILLLSIFLSHRIAGPLYKLNLFFQMGKEGNVQKHLSFRKYDHFKEVAQGYNDFVGAIDKRLDSARSKLSEAIKKAEAGDAAGAARLAREAQTEIQL